MITRQAYNLAYNAREKLMQEGVFGQQKRQNTLNELNSIIQLYVYQTKHENR